LSSDSELCILRAMDKILIHPATELYFGCNVLHKIHELCHGHRMCVIADEAVKHLVQPTLTIPSGEKSKTREMKQKLEDQLFQAGFGRDTVIVAVGGGVTTDLVGFVASTYMRGVPLILVPTTLLAMVDASIGGKNGVDTPFGKNLVGTFYPPKAIVADLDTLKTLPERELANGRAEIFKMKLIWDASIEPEDVLKAMKAKIAVVEKDPKESGLRRILNFGHTIGHAIELVANFEIPHGEAVMIGCAAESWLSQHFGYLKTAIPFPKVHWKFDRKKLHQAMMHDKKKAKGEVRVVCIDRIGHAMEFDGQYCRAVSEQDLEACFAYMEKTYG